MNECYADSLSVNGQIVMPLVILKKPEDKTKFLGFIPGVTKKDIIEDSVEKCKEMLKRIANEAIKEIAKNNLPFPFFPTDKEICSDFKGVVEIIHIKICSQKRTN